MVIKILEVLLETENQTNAHAFLWITQPRIDLWRGPICFYMYWTYEKVIT